MQPSVCLEYLDGEWFVARPQTGSSDLFSHEKVGEGYRSAQVAADAAIAYATAHDLPVLSRIEMIEEAEEMLAFFATQAK